MTETRSCATHDARDSAPAQRWTVVPPVATPSAPPSRQGLRTSLAITAGRITAALSRRLRYGSGAMIGGRVAFALCPDVLTRLTSGRQVVMVTGTNGKTTTTRLVAEALRSRGPAVSNATGANMLDGHVAALMTDRHAPFAALEVDELHLAQVTRRFTPDVVVLLNLSRDQLDRVGEIRTVAESIRKALTRAPNTHVVANRDDPNIVAAAWEHPSTTWVSGGARWLDDAQNCPRCGAFLTDLGAAWRCECGLARPAAQWTVADAELTGPDGERYAVPLHLPGQVNRINAAFALATADWLGCDRRTAMQRMTRVDQAEGRYGTVRLGDRAVRLLLAKNPASWLEMLDLVAGNGRELVLVVNSREADGADVSWLWDVDFTALAGRTVAVAGDRAWDLAVRLRYAGVRCRVFDEVPRAVTAASSADVPDVIANYTAFRDLYARSRK